MTENTTAYELTELSVPMATARTNDTRYLPRHVDVQIRDRQQRENLRQLVDGLGESRARLKSGKYVSTAADAIRWMLENIGLPMA